MKSNLQTLSEDFKTHKAETSKDIKDLKLWIGLIRRGLIVIGLWLGSVTGQLNTDQIADIAVSILKRVLTGG